MILIPITPSKVGPAWRAQYSLDFLFECAIVGYDVIMREWRRHG